MASHPSFIPSALGSEPSTACATWKRKGSFLDPLHSDEPCIVPVTPTLASKNPLQISFLCRPPLTAQHVVKNLHSFYEASFLLRFWRLKQEKCLSLVSKTFGESAHEVPSWPIRSSIKQYLARILVKSRTQNWSRELLLNERAPIVSHVMQCKAKP
jgi:hypothetical protein